MRISQGFKDWRRMQDIREMEHRRKIEAINCEQLRIDTKAHRLAGINKKMKDAEKSMDNAKAREEMELRVYKLAQQEELAAQLANIKQEEFKELKLRQQLRESSQELRDLEAKLRTAYVSKDLAAQIREKQLKAKHSKLEEERVLELMYKVEQEQREEDAKKMQEEHRRKLNYRHELQQQMRESIAKREEAFQQFLKDKLLLDDITRIIHEEDMREEEMKMLNKKRTKEEMDKFNRARQLWREREKAVVEEEDRRLVEYWVKKNAEAEDVALKEKCEKQALERRRQVIMDYILEAKRKKEMEREALEQLVMDEHALKEEERMRMEMETALRERIQLKCIYEKQKRERLEQLQREAELDELYRQQMLMKFAEDERIEQLTKERRRQKILDHRKQVEEMILDRQRKRSEEIQALKAMKELEDRQIELRHKMVEEERLRLLQEHAKHVLGYLPKGVLRPNDLPHIGSALIEPGNSHSK